jgi:Type VI secretion system VasI, EvfG, VC_A0118
MPPEPANRARQKMALFGAGGVLVGITIGLLLMARSGISTSEPRTQSPATSPRIANETAVDEQPIIDADAAPTWVGRRKAVWARDGSKMIAFEVSALNDVAAWAARARPSLVVRCLGGRTEVFVALGTAASIESHSDSHTVRLQIDGGAPSEQHWTDSESTQELFAPNGVALAKHLARARTLRFGFTPYNSKPVVADFNVSGFDELVGLVASTCHWRDDDPHRRAASR